MTATDGRYIAGLLSESEDAKPSEAFTIPTKLIRRAPLPNKLHRLATIELNGRVEISLGGDLPSVAMLPIVGTYPQTKQVWAMAKGKVGELGEVIVNPVLFAKIHTAQQRLGLRANSVSFSRVTKEKGAPIIVRLHGAPNLAIIVMPVNDIYLPGLPTWLCE